MRARLPARVEPRVRGGRRHDARTAGEPDRDGTQADAAARAEHEKRLAGTQPCEVDQPVPARAVVELEARRRVRVHGRREEALAGVDERELGKAAADAGSKDLLADCHSGDTLADRNHLAAYLLARCERGVLAHHVLALDNEHVREGQAGAEDPHERSAGQQLGLGHGAQAEDVGVTAGRRGDDSLHLHNTQLDERSASARLAGRAVLAK